MSWKTLRSVQLIASAVAGIFVFLTIARNSMEYTVDQFGCRRFLCFPSYLGLNFFRETMSVSATESIDDLVREAESLKTRLEEERAKFNDVDRKSNHRPIL